MRRRRWWWCWWTFRKLSFCLSPRIASLCLAATSAAAATAAPLFYDTATLRTALSVQLQFSGSCSVANLSAAPFSLSFLPFFFPPLFSTPERGSPLALARPPHCHSVMAMHSVTAAALLKRHTKSKVKRRQ